MAVTTHLMVDGELYDKHLLQDSGSDNLSLHCQLELDAARVRLCPDEACIHQLHAVQALHLAQTQGQHLTWLQRATHPLVRWLQVPAIRLVPYYLYWIYRLTQKGWSDWKCVALAEQEPLAAVCKSAIAAIDDREPCFCCGKVIQDQWIFYYRATTVSAKFRCIMWWTDSWSQIN